MATLTFLLNFLAVARLSFLVVDEPGPFNVFSKIREKFGLVVIIKEDEQEEKVKFVDDTASEFYKLMQGILDCKWCASVWMSGLVYLLSLSIYTKPVIYILALSMAAIVVFQAKDAVASEGKG